MTTRAYSTLGQRAYGEPMGIRLVTALESTGADLFTTTQAVRQGMEIGLSAGHTATLLHHLSEGGRISRLKKGVYAINDPASRMPKPHPFAIGGAMVVPSAVSHWSALQHWGLTEQVPSTITLSSPIRTFPPDDEGPSITRRHAWMFSGLRYEFIAITRPRFFGDVEVWVNERDRVSIFDRERALLDTFHHFHIFGSLSVALEILETHLADLDIDRLVRYAERLGIAAVVKRIGWALDYFGASPEILEPLRAYPSKGDSPLDPGQPALGRHNRDWRVIENLNHGR
ncbi:MAG: hypothetical protein Q7O66_09990 [Dehalococcoidia bacterium]|nr:hypothetical protein [Dehalococcoidia bacterium]